MKQLIAISVLMMTAGSVHASETTKLFDAVTKSDAYKTYAGKSDFSCESVVEVSKASKKYGSPGLGNATYRMVVLDCAFDPKDGGDPIREAGLAVVTNDNQVVSFGAHSYPQPD